MFENLPHEVIVYEVGPRDGLQNEARYVPTEIKVQLIETLAQAGLKKIEATSFVHPQLVPQMADAETVCAQVKVSPTTVISGLVPNLKGLERALQTTLKEIGLVLSVSETHNQKNIRRSIKDSLQEYRQVVEQAHQKNILVRSYVSTVFGCPYEGKIKSRDVIRVYDMLKSIGVDEISLGDTIGVATPREVYDLCRQLLKIDGDRHLALHLHNTRGTALANIIAGLEAGIKVFDSSAGGLGGCPYAPGASGNLATEDLVYMLHGIGVKTGVDVIKVSQAALMLESYIGHDIASNFTQSIREGLQSGKHIELFSADIVS